MSDSLSQGPKKPRSYKKYKSNFLENLAAILEVMFFPFLLKQCHED